jgi:UDP-glucose 4-epimerase
MEKILITGGNGYIGSYLAQYLKKQGYYVIITTRNKVVHCDFETRQMDLLDESTIYGICNDIDIVIHTATMDERKISGNEKDTFLVNAYGTSVLYQDAVKNSVKKFIYLSTFHIYGKNQGRIDENTEPNPISNYGLSHYFAELYLRQLARTGNCETIILRLTNGIGVPMMGSDKWYLVVNDFCKTVYDKQEIIMKSSGLALRDFVSITDIVKGIEVIILKKSRNKELIDIYNISAQVSYSIKDVALMVSEIYKKRYNKEVILNFQEKAEKEEAQLFISSKKIRKLGWKNNESIIEVTNEIFNYLENR